MNEKIKENEYERDIRIALEMIKNKDSIEMIAKRFSLSIDEVKRIREENNL